MTVGSYAGPDLQWFVRHESTNVPLVEVQGVSWAVDRHARTAGAGIGQPRSWHQKQGVPGGTFALDRHMLQVSDQGRVFLDLLAGTAYLDQEPIAVGVQDAVLSQTAICVVKRRALWYNDGIMMTLHRGIT